MSILNNKVREVSFENIRKFIINIAMIRRALSEGDIASREEIDEYINAKTVEYNKKLEAVPLDILYEFLESAMAAK